MEVQNRECPPAEHGVLQFVAEWGLGFSRALCWISPRPSPRTQRHQTHFTAMSSIMRSVCGQLEMGKFFDCIVVASKVEEDRRVAQMVSNFCVSEDAAVRQGGLSTIKQWWETATKSVKDSLANADVTCFRRVVIWPSLRWVRETCLRLYNFKWQTPSPEVDKQVRAIAVMQPGAKSVEDTIGHCKGAAEQSSAMKLSAAATWHSASTGGIIEGLGWRQPRRTLVAQMCARSDGVSTTAFECNHKDFSLVTDVLREFNTDRPHVVQRGFEQAQMDGTRLETGRREEW